MALRSLWQRPDNFPEGIFPPGIIGGDYDRDPFGGGGFLGPGRGGMPGIGGIGGPGGLPGRGGIGGIGPGLLPDGRLPRGGRVPGARFDPFNPLGGGQRGNRARNPDDPFGGFGDGDFI